MNSRVVLRLVALAATLVVVGGAFAQRNLNVAAAPASEQRVALVIGNSAYKDSPLANPVNDATDIAKALQDAGFKVILKRNASTRDMRQAIRELGGELRRAQVGLFYFAGHGVQVKGANYLVPVGADIQGEADIEDLAIDANYALRTMEEAQVKVSIVILDACRNNPFARSFRSASRGLAQMNAATGSLIAFATAPGAVAADGSGRNGIYTKHLLASLSQADTDILKVFQRTRAAVVKETGGRQTPWESTSLIGDFYFRPPSGDTKVATVAPSAPVAVQANPTTDDRAFWESIKDSRDPEEFNAYLEQFPNGRFAGIARARLKSMTPAARPPAQVATVAPLTQTTPAPAAAAPSAAGWAQRMALLEKSRGQLTLSKAIAILLDISAADDLSLVQSHEAEMKRKGWPSAYAMGIDSGGNLIWGGGDRWGTSNFAAETALEHCARSSGDFCKVLMINGEFKEQGFLEVAQRLQAQNPDAMRQAYLQSLRQPYTESRYGTTRNPNGYGFSSPRDSQRRVLP